MTLKYNSLPRKTLAEPLTSSATSFRLNNIKKWDGTDLAESDFGTEAYGVIRDAKGTVVEFFAFDPATIADADIDFTYRGLAYNGTNLTTEIAGNKLTWGKGSIVELGTHGPQIFQWLQELIEGIAIAGAPDATTAVKGIGTVSTAPADPNTPIFVGDNDPRIVQVANAVATSSGASDEGKLVKLDSDGKIPAGFITSPIDQQLFTENGTWTKPSSGVFAYVEVWGAGGSGGAINSVSYPAAGGGGGGEYRASIFPLALLPATVSVTVGAGGASVSASNNGNDGGDTSFGTYTTAVGGKKGIAGQDTEVSGGAGGTGGVAGVLNVVNADGGAGGGANSTIFNTVADAGGNSTYGGGGGGGASKSVYAAGGVNTSLSGDGGDAGRPAEQGEFPSGGGGGSTIGTGDPCVSGAGANGYCRVTVF